MADDSTVEISFRASTDDVLSGIAQVKDGLNELAAQVSSISGSLGRLGETFGAALQPELINQSAKAFGTMGTAAQGAASQTKAVGDAVKAQMEQYQAAVKAADTQYNQTKSLLESEVKDHEITYDQETQALLKALADRHAATMATLNDESQTAGLSEAQYKKIQSEKLLADQKYIADRQKIVQQAAQQEAKEWKAAADQVASAFNSQLKGLLSGTTTWSKAMKSISADLVLKMIEDQVKLTLEWLASQARILAAAIATQTGMTAASTAGAALRSAAEVASGQTSILSVVENALKAIFAGAGQTAAGVSGNMAPEVGPAAPAFGAAAGAAVVAMGTALAGGGGAAFDVGTNYVVRGGLALIHPGETIVPAGVPTAQGSGPYTAGRNAGGTAGGDVHLNISALDSRSIARFFNDNAGHMINALNRGIKSGAHLRGARA